MRAFKCDICGDLEEGEPSSHVRRFTVAITKQATQHRYVLEVYVRDPQSNPRGDYSFTSDDICMSCMNELINKIKTV